MKGLRLVVAGLLGALPIGGCSDAQAKRHMAAEVSVPAMWEISTRSEEAAREARAGVYALDVGRGGMAHEHFQRAIAADPGFAFGYLMAGTTAPSLQQRLAHLERAEQHGASASEVERLLLAMHRRRSQGDARGALEIAERLVRAEPLNARAWMALGDRQSFLDREQEARVAWSKAAELAPDLVGAVLALANSYIYIEPVDIPRAEAQIQRAIELAPGESLPYDILGDLRRAQGRLDEAGRAYSRAMELSPRIPIYVQQRGHVHLLKGDTEKALADYAAAIALAPSNGKAAFALWRAAAYLMAGDRTAAIQELQQLVEAVEGLGIPDPLDMKVPALVELAQTTIHYGQFDLAEAAVAQLVELSRRRASETGSERIRRALEADAVFLDALLAARRDDYALADRKVREYMRLAEPVRHSRNDERAHLVMGMVALRQGRHAEAVEHFDQAHQWNSGAAVEGDPWEWYTAFHRGLALEGAGRTLEAQQVFRAIVEDHRVTTSSALVRNEAKARLKG